jgi:hypothetical protein
MHATRKSDKSIRAKKLMNKGNQPGRTAQKPAESVEQRGLAEGNADGPPTNGTLSPRKVSGVTGVGDILCSSCQVENSKE